MSGPDPAAVEATFSSVAPRYDLANHWLSGGIDFYWRNRLVKFAKEGSPQDILDLATGSGDVLFALRNGLGNEVNLTGLDFCEPMLEQARRKRTVRGLGELANQFLHGDCLALPFEDESFDLITIAFGLRNLADRAKGLQGNAPGAPSRWPPHHSGVQPALPVVSSLLLFVPAWHSSLGCPLAYRGSRCLPLPRHQHCRFSGPCRFGH